MKKIILGLALIASATLAAAQVSAITRYDFGFVAGSNANTQALDVGLATNVAGYGVEALATGDFTRGGGQRTNGLGYEVAASKAFAPISGVTPSVRLGAGHKTLDTGEVNYFVVDAFARKALTPVLTAVVDYSYRNTFNADAGFRSNSVSAGVEYALNKKITVGASYLRTVGEGYIINGVTTTVAYAF